MKALQTALLALFTLIIMTGCALRNESHTPEVTPAANSSDFSSIAATYFFETHEIEEPYRPKLLLNADGTFEFAVNLLTQMGNIEGTYTAESNTVVLEVDTIDFEGFQGEHTKSIIFDVTSDKNLMYRGTDAGEDQPIGMTNPYDLFTKLDINASDLSK